MLRVVEIFCMRHTRLVLNAADDSALMKAHLKWCNSKTCCRTCLLHKKTGRVHVCAVRSGSALYSRQAAAFASAYQCVCWCLKRQSILLKSTHSCLTMRQSSNVLVNKNHAHLHPHPLSAFIVFVLVFPFSSKTLILFRNTFQIANIVPLCSPGSPSLHLALIYEICNQVIFLRQQLLHLTGDSCISVGKICNTVRFNNTDTQIILRLIMTRQQYSAPKSMRTGPALESKESGIVQLSTHNKLILLLKMEYLNSLAFLFWKQTTFLSSFYPRLAFFPLSLVFRPEKEDLLLLSGLCDLSDQSWPQTKVIWKFRPDQWLDICFVEQRLGPVQLEQLISSTGKATRPPDSLTHWANLLVLKLSKLSHAKLENSNKKHF